MWAADVEIIVIFRTVVTGAEVNLERARGLQPGTVMRAGERTVQQLDAVEIRGAGDALDFRGHLLKFAVDHQTLHGIIGAGGRLLGQFLHAYQFFVNDAERAVGGLDKGNGVIGVVDALMQRGHVGPHESRTARPAASSAACSTRRPEERRRTESLRRA